MLLLQLDCRCSECLLQFLLLYLGKYHSRSGIMKQAIFATKLDRPKIHCVNVSELCRDWCLLDPTLEEERNAQGHICFNVNEDGVITNFQHTGLRFTQSYASCCYT